MAAATWEGSTFDSHIFLIGLEVGLLTTVLLIPILVLLRRASNPIRNVVMVCYLLGLPTLMMTIISWWILGYG